MASSAARADYGSNGNWDMLSRHVTGVRMARRCSLRVVRAVAVLLPLSLASHATRGEENERVPDLSGYWARNSLSYETPSTGPGPVENASRLPSGARNRTMLVGDVTNPILTPKAAEIVKHFGEFARAGQGFPDPNNQCWPEGP